MARRVLEMSENVATTNRLFHAQRELRMVRRVLLHVLILVIIVLPYLIFVLMSFFRSAPKYSFRTAHTFISPDLVLLKFALLQMSESLQTSTMKRIHGRLVRVIRTVA
ncbi:unnamed protein product [Rotaria socialis]|uniref:Uncharacterized protein n=1 Tax=Rotaria socialis TaxID=392032 RepID=A0A821FU24_9BILA|nr:unnamed protein product [Rotaria socialis]CAF4656080.1 unnamed protein product [Rotaria socialis]